MYDDNLAILEDADYTADMFWLEGEESEDSFPFTADEEMDMVTLDQAATIIQEMREKFKDASSSTAENIARFQESAQNATKGIKDFLNTIQEMRGE